MAETERGEETWSCVCSDGEIIKLDVDQLSDHSSYFAAMMQSQMRETYQRTIDMRLISSNTLKFLLNIFHMSVMPQSEQELQKVLENNLSLDAIEEMLEAIDYLDMPGLYPKCCDMLKAMMPTLGRSVILVWRVWQCCQLYGLRAVETNMSEYIATNLTSVQEVDYFFIRELPLELLVCMLSRADIDVLSEVDIMTFIMEWVTYYRFTREQHVEKLFHCLHIPSMFHSELSKVQTMLNNLNCRESDVSKMFSKFVLNPHKFLTDFPEQNFIRRGKDIVMVVGGCFEQHLSPPPGNNPTGRRRRLDNPSHPMFFQSLDDVCDQCMKNQKKVNAKPKPSTSKETSLFGTALRLKSFIRLKSPVTLVEFGTCLMDNFLYVTGGQRRRNDEARFAVKGAYRLDPHIGEWVEICAMKEARCLFNMEQIWGRLYAVGGANLGGILQSIEYYLPEEDVWQYGPELPTKLHEHAGCVHDNKLYISGGHDDTEHTTRLLCLESRDGKWKRLAPMLQARSYHSMASVGGHIYVLGGCAAVEDTIKDIYMVEVYDIKTDFWTSLVNINVPVGNCLPIVVDDQIICIGGYSFDQNEYLQQMVVMDTKKLSWRITPVEFPVNKKLVGYYCVKMEIRQRLLK